jgi:hypothetical protein
MAGSGTHQRMTYNRGLIEDPAAFAREHGAVSWLYLCGEDFADADGGMSFAQVASAVPESARIVSDPPVPMTMELAREQLAALDALPRPTLVTCRTGPRSSALVYLYGGLQSGESADDVLRQAEQDGAPFTKSDELKAWVAKGLAELG